jgi:hypothetical protein
MSLTRASIREVNQTGYAKRISLRNIRTIRALFLSLDRGRDARRIYAEQACRFHKFLAGEPADDFVKRSARIGLSVSEVAPLDRLGRDAQLPKGR